MYASVLVILLFQVYWLRRVYSDTYRNLQREISVVLREAFLKEQLQSLFGDSANQFFRRDTVNFNGNRLSVVQISDTLKHRTEWTSKDSIKVEIRAGRGSDTVKRMDGPPRIMAFEQAEEDKGIGDKLIVTLPISTKLYDSGKAKEVYRKVLESAGLPSSFAISKTDLDKDNNRHLRQPGNHGPVINRRGMQMVLVDLDFGNPVIHILTGMWGQVALAFFMTGMIILAFSFMYKSMQEQNRMAALKNDFISNMTHELKTPVATVSVAIEALKNFSVLDNPQRTREYLDISAAELNRLSLLIDKVLRINMFEAEKLEIERQLIDLTALTSEVVQAQQLQAEKLYATIRWQSPPQSIYVKGDRLHLMSVLYNLLDNALKYRSDHPVIEVGLTQQGQKVAWTVKDNGPGIAAEYREKIFEKFFRVPQGDRHDIKGYGLGLSYVSEVVQKHGGTINADCEPGNGCIFTVNLPVENNPS